MKRLKDLELENTRLRKAVSELTLDKLILQEVRKQLYFSERPAVAALAQRHSMRRKVSRGLHKR